MHTGRIILRNTFKWGRSLFDTDDLQKGQKVDLGQKNTPTQMPVKV
jgi:hypothetical protein